MPKLNHHPRPESRRAQDDRQRGAVMVEAAFGLPILTMLVFGIIAFGPAYSNANITVGASRTGARLASASYAPAANKATQANLVASAVAADLANLNNATPIEMWMYEADGTTGLPSTGSAFTSCTTNCIRWTWNTNTKAWNSSSGSWTDPNGCGATLDYVGVWVKVSANLGTGLFGSRSITITQRTSMRIEPVSNTLCT